MQGNDPFVGRHYHLLGIAGRGMAPLAIAARHLGAAITGCDRAGQAEGIASLRAAGIEFESAHSPDHVVPGRTVVATAAADAAEPEVAAARAAGLLWHRTDLLAALLATRASAGITGSHGKGTVAALCAAALAASGLDPLALLGAEVPALGGMARIGSGPIVAEVDDSDLTLSRVDTDVAVVTNLDDDHPYLDTTLQEALEAVGGFVARAQSKVILGPSPRAARIEGYARTEVWRYGRDFEGRVSATDAGDTHLRLRGPDGSWIPAVVRLLGAKTQLNAALAFASALALGADPHAAADGLATVQSISRRMEPLGTRDGVRVFDDFGGKHPANVRAGIEALRRHFPGAAITAVFEPYGPYLPRWGRRYARSLSGADRVVIAPAAYVADYPAGPPVDPRWTEACGVEPVLVVDRHEAAVSAMSGCRPGDVVVVFAQVRAGRLTAELAVGGQAT